jgi:hypothetical protein
MAKRRDHWVPKSYLKYWTLNENSEGVLWVRMYSDGVLRKTKPSKVGCEDRLYDLTDIEIADILGKEFLERGLLSRVLEPALPKMMNKFRLPQPTASDDDVLSMVFLALNMHGRNPASITFIRHHFEQRYPEDLSHPIFRSRGNTALLAMLVLSSQIKLGVYANLLYAPEGAFITTDNPCSYWTVKDGVYECGTVVPQQSADAAFWLFPINPKCLLEFGIGNGKVDINRQSLGDESVQRYNALLRRSAYRFVVEGYWPSR